jgi:nicotinamidase-related amidase
MVFGIATSGVVLSTVLQGADMDYRVVVIKDCCVDLDPDLHTCLVDKVLPRPATVVSADEVVNALTVL